MRARVQKWDNDLVIRIPQALADMSTLEEGSDVELTIEADHLLVTPVRRRKYTLDELLAQVDENDLQPELDTGPSVGEEAW
jgi:antitoxin MazE